MPSRAAAAASVFVSLVRLRAAATPALNNAPFFYFSTAGRAVCAAGDSPAGVLRGGRA